MPLVGGPGVLHRRNKMSEKSQVIRVTQEFRQEQLICPHCKMENFENLEVTFDRRANATFRCAVRRRWHNEKEDGADSGCDKLYTASWKFAPSEVRYYTLEEVK